MAWKFTPGTSLSEQIAERIKMDIVNGVYPPGSPFPTVRQLAFEASVNPNTMQKALTALEDDGLLITLSTQGRIVTSDGNLIKKAGEYRVKKEINKMILHAREMSLSFDEFIILLQKGWNENE